LQKLRGDADRNFLRMITADWQTHWAMIEISVGRGQVRGD
jgi:hypothetical protein